MAGCRFVFVQLTFSKLILDALLIYKQDPYSEKEFIINVSISYKVAVPSTNEIAPILLLYTLLIVSLDILIIEFKFPCELKSEPLSRAKR